MDHGVANLDSGRPAISQYASDPPFQQRHQPRGNRLVRCVHMQRRRQLTFERFQNRAKFALILAAYNDG